MMRGGEILETKSKLASKSTHKTKLVWILRGCPHAQLVLLFDKVRVEDPREILDRLHGRKSALENIVSCDSLRHIDSMGRVWVGSALNAVGVSFQTSTLETCSLRLAKTVHITCKICQIKSVPLAPIKCILIKLTSSTRKYYIEKHKESIKYLFDVFFQIPMHE
jgi:hypothetical protein